MDKRHPDMMVKNNLMNTMENSKNLAENLLKIMKTCEENAKDIHKQATDKKGDDKGSKSENKFIDGMKAINDKAKFIRKFLNSWVWIEKERLTMVNLYITVCNAYVKQNSEGETMLIQE